MCVKQRGGERKNEAKSYSRLGPGQEEFRVAGKRK